MRILMTPQHSRFTEETIHHAKKLAKQALEIEMKTRTGDDAEGNPMKIFVFGKDGTCYPIWGDIFGPLQKHPFFDNKVAET